MDKYEDCDIIYADLLDRVKQLEAELQAEREHADRLAKELMVWIPYDSVITGIVNQMIHAHTERRKK